MEGFPDEGAGIFTTQRFPRSTQTKAGKLQGAELASIFSNYNADGILGSMQRVEAGQPLLASEEAGFYNF